MRNRAKGKAFERRVEKMLRYMGKKRIRRNVVLKDGWGNVSEIDGRFLFCFRDFAKNERASRAVVYGRFFKTYVECKSYSRRSVPLSDVAKFKEVLVQNNIPPSAGLFVSNATYVPRAYKVGIRLVDGKELKRWERRARWNYFFWRPVRICIGLGVAYVVLDADRVLNDVYLYLAFW